MAHDRQPPSGAKASAAPAAAAPPADADLEEDVAAKAKSAEDRKAAVALASLDAVGGGDAAGKHVDQEAISKAMKNLKLGASGAAAKKVKVDVADVALLVEQLDLTKAKATDLLKQHEGDAVQALRAYVSVA